LAVSKGWLVLYIPNARKLTIESSYQKDEASGLWDTPDHAHLFLELALAGNREHFAGIMCEGGSLVDVATNGLDAFGGVR